MTTYPKTILQSVAQSISDVLFPIFSSVQDKIDQLTESLKSACKLFDFLIYPMAIGLFVCGDNFIQVLLTEKWLPCVPYLRIMCLYYLCTPSSGIMLQAIKALGKGSAYFKLECFKKGYGIVLLLLSLFLFDTPYAIAVSIVVSGVISLIVNVVAVSKYTGYRVRDYVLGVLPILAISVIMAAAVYAVNLFGLGSLATLILQVVVGVITYGGLAWLFRFKQLRDLISLIKKKKEN